MNQLTLSFMCGLLSILFASATHSAQPGLREHSQGIWSLPANNDATRWLIIHDLAHSAQSGVYHIEILSRGVHDPVWQVKHLANHMAITEPALQRSVDAPLQKGDVYPEAFDDGYKKWQSENNGSGGVVCQTDVLSCLPR